MFLVTHIQVSDKYEFFITHLLLRVRILERRLARKAIFLLFSFAVFVFASPLQSHCKSSMTFKIGWPESILDNPQDTPWVMQAFG